MTPTPLAPMQGRGGPVQRGLGGREAFLWSIGAAESARMPPGRHYRKKNFGVERNVHFTLFEDSATGDAVPRLRPQSGR